MSPSSSFVSWQSADLAWVRRFVEHLREVGLPVHWHPEDGRPGELWPLGISRAMEGAEFFLPVFSPEYFESRACEVELNAALAAEMTTRRNYILPVLLRTAKLPLLLSAHQYVDMRDPQRYADRLRELVTRIAPEEANRFVILARTPAVAPSEASRLVSAHGIAEYDDEWEALDKRRSMLEGMLLVTAHLPLGDPELAWIERELDGLHALMDLHESLREAYG